MSAEGVGYGKGSAPFPAAASEATPAAANNEVYHHPHLEGVAQGSEPYANSTEMRGQYRLHGETIVTGTVVQDANVAAHVAPGSGRKVYAIVSAITSCICLIFLIIASAQPWYTATNLAYEVQVTVWNSRTCLVSVCSTDSHNDHSCGELKHRMRAIQAFLIISFIAVLAQTIMTFAEVCCRGPGVIPGIISGATVVVTLIPFAIGAGTYNVSMCGFASLASAYFEYGSGFICAVLAWICQVAGTALYFGIAHQQRAIA